MRAWGLLLLLGAALGAGEAKRIASLSPAATRILVDLGCADRICVATRWCNLPAGHPAARQMDALEPDIEQLVAAQPDAVLLPRLANPLLAERLRRAGLAVTLLTPEAKDSPATDILVLGELTGRSLRATELVAERRALRPAGERRVLVIWGGVVAGPDSYLAWAIEAAGGRPAPKSGAWPQLDLEQISNLDPDLVLVIRSGGPPTPRPATSTIEEWKSTPGLRLTRCASKGYIFEVEESSCWLPASGLPEAARKLAELLEQNP